MTNGGKDSQTRELATTVSAVAAAFGAAATLVIVPGGLALYLRLRTQDLPDDPGVVLSLPNQFLIGIGVGYLLIPLLLIGGLAVIVLLVPGGSDEPNPKLPAPKPLWGKQIWGRVASWVVTAAVLCAIGVAGKVPSVFFDAGPPWWVVLPAILGAIAVWIAASIFIARQKRGSLKGLAERIPAVDLAAQSTQWTGFLLVVFVVALAAGLPFAIDSTPPWWSFPLAALTVVFWLALSGPVARKYEPEVLSLMGVAMTALVTVLVLLPWAVAFGAFRGQFPDATVCTTDGGRFDGVLVGETGTRVYVGEPRVQVVAFVPGRLREPVEESLRGAKTGVTLEEDPAHASFGRADAVLVNLEHEPPFDLESLVRVANAPELGFARTDNLERTKRKAQKAGFDLIRSRPRIVDNLPALIDLLLQREQSERARNARAVTPKPSRRIASIPSDRVSQIFIGGSGNCPAVPTTGP